MLIEEDQVESEDLERLCQGVSPGDAVCTYPATDKDVVRRILTRHYRPGQDSDGLSGWLSSAT